jgi:hypothetical protein
MAILNNSNAISSGGYDINNSLRIRKSASAYLNRTPASAGNRKTYTWSGWVKRGELSTDQAIFSAGYTTGTFDANYLQFTSSNTLYFQNVLNGSGAGQLSTSAVFRDPSAWYHIVVAVDTTQATASDRAKLYVNGVQQTVTFTSNFTLNADTQVNNTSVHSLGRFVPDGFGGAVWQYFDGYLADVNLIDGQALTPSSFGETDTTTGSWKPKAYTGTYGTNGFYLKFSDIATTSGSNAGLGKDFSGNTNYWTTNNISVTAGTTYDAMIDSPTLTSATVANYCVLSPLAGDVAPTNGNLSVSGVDKSTLGTVGVSSGKWYFEMTCVSNVATTNLDGVGIGNCGVNNAAPDKAFYIYRSSGVKLQNGGSNTAYGASFTTGDVIGVAYDADAGTLVFYKNNSSQGTAFTGITGTMLPIVYARGITSTPTLALNFGQQPFIYTPPTGFVRLNTYNLPDSTIKKGNTVMDATLYTGDGATTKSITNASSFKPDLIWIKGRSNTGSNLLQDSNRGFGTATKLSTNSTNAENNASADATDPIYGYITAANSNGFSVNVGTTPAQTNVSGVTYVGWQWQAGQGSTSSNTSGNVTSTVSLNASAGFSIVTANSGSAGNKTVGHGLGVAPKLVIMKVRSATGGWYVWTTGFSSSQFLVLNATDAVGTDSRLWANATPTSSVVSFESGYYPATSQNLVFYCWAEIAGFSKFGSYTGNGSADGVFVYTGFVPKFVLIKKTSGADNWLLYDTARDTYNVAGKYLSPNLFAAEGTDPALDMLSNGFKIRQTGGGINGSGATYIYAAFAENPFKNSNAR